MKSLFFSVLLISFAEIAHAGESVLRFSYWTEASPPFVIFSDTPDKTLKKGVLKDLALEIASALNKQAEFVNLPVKRIEPQLLSGEIHIDCITQPAWKMHPDLLHWSPVLFRGADRFLVKRDRKLPLNTFKDLSDKRLGIYNGYTYHPEIMDMIEKGDIQSVKVSGIDHGVTLLSLDRIDALIDFDILLNHKIKSGDHNDLILADLIAEEYDLYCAYSPKMPVEAALVDEVIERLISSGKLNEVLHRY
jgi:ABC-type amino acid transport substrate-binding protein